ncbi:hypothetical protein VTL71DRAFT_10939 [Oculimacula yallundae]|uniref:Uncharacterized protein n=1 Tax=Oculimacula yallundae TaxID=86028 RepID=A0ABR4CW77_9HELO
MGLPLFITPVEPEVASKAAEKIASQPRSSIRRQRTLRGPHARLTAEARRRRILGLMPEAEQYEDVPEGQRGNEPNYTEGDSLASSSGLSRALRLERLRMRDPLSFEREHASILHIDGPLMPPVPESRDYSVAEERQREIYRLRHARQSLRRMSRRHPAPTPPYTDMDLAFTRQADSPRLSSSLTPVLSPSRQASTGSMPSPPHRSLEENDFTNISGGPPTTETAGRSSLSEEAQFLSRQRSVVNAMRLRRLNRQARLDGLGDRDRSLSPEGGAAWDILLTSITPDPQVPSAGSSFASISAAAAAASSPSGSGPSSGSASASTSMTSLDATGEHECDVSDSGTNTEDEEEDIYEIQELSGNGGRGDRFWRSYADVVTARAERRAERPLDQEVGLGDMRRIMSRLARREELLNDVQHDQATRALRQERTRRDADGSY